LFSLRSRSLLSVPRVALRLLRFRTKPPPLLLPAAAAVFGGWGLHFVPQSIPK
jgi:hypothetical protein